MATATANMQAYFTSLHSWKVIAKSSKPLPAASMLCNSFHVLLKVCKYCVQSPYDKSPEHKLLNWMLLWRARSMMAILPPNDAVRQPPVAMTRARRKTMIDACIS